MLCATIFIAYILRSVGKVPWTLLYNKYLPAVKSSLPKAQGPSGTNHCTVVVFGRKLMMKSWLEFFCLNKANMWSVELLNPFFI